MDESREKIGRYLFYNPWSRAPVIRRIAGLSRRDLGVLRDGIFFERRRVPCRDGRGYQGLYALTANGEVEVAGFCRSRRLLGEALLMSYSRLARAREALVELASTGWLLWSISPWRTTRHAPNLDALVSLRRSQDKASLAALVLPLKGAGLPWYLEVLKSWASWRKVSQAIPAMLILWNPTLPPHARKFLSQFVPQDPHSPVVCLFGKIAAGKSGLLLLEPVLGGGGRERRWRPPSSIPAALLRQEAYLPDARSGKFRIDISAPAWAKREPREIAHALAFFTQAHPGEIQTLEMIARFPGLSAWGYRQLNPQKKARRLFGNRLRALVAARLVEEAPETGERFPTRYFLTEKGLAFLAGLAGISPKAQNRSLGFPVRPGQFKNERSHLGLIQDFMLRLQSEQVLLAWDFTAARYVYTGLEAPARAKIQRLVIQPDSAGALILENHRYQLFWLEVDRGTRRGKRLTWKLEKYFLAHFAAFATGSIPPLLVLVDASDGRDESRLRYLARSLARLGEKYPGTGFRALLTTGELLGNCTGSILETPIWRFFDRGATSSELLSLQEAFTKGS